MREKPPSLLSEVRAFLWLKSREMLGDSRSPLRLWLFASLMLLWVLFLCTASFLGSPLRPHHGLDDLFVVASSAWPLWAVVPLIGGGAGEVQDKDRLAPYPVSVRAHLAGAWLSAFFDFPYLLALPPLLGVSLGVGHLPGLLAALCFVVGTSATGQLGAWLTSSFLAGRTRPGLRMLLLTLLAVVLFSLGRTLLPAAATLGHVLPGGWLTSALSSSGASFFLWCALLLSPALLFLLVGPRVVARSLDRESTSSGPALKPLSPSRLTSGEGLVFLTTLRSILRSTAAQTALAGVLAAPFVTRLPLGPASAGATSISLTTIGLIAALALAATLAVNALAFDAGGILLLLASPLSPRRLALVKALALALVLLVSQIAVTLIALFLTHSSPSTLLSALLVDLERSLAFAALGVRWGVARPVSVDFESMRTRVASPRSVVTFFLTASFWASLLTSLAGRSLPFVLLSLLLSLLLLLYYTLQSARDLSKDGSARLASALAA